MQVVFYDLEHDYDSDGNHDIPVEVILNGQGNTPVVIDAIIDTGASISLFDKSVAQLLGIDIPTGKPLKVRTASNDEYDAYIHPVDLEFLGLALNIPIAFCPAWDDVTNLLGMEGFAEALQLGLKHAERTLLVRRA